MRAIDMHVHVPEPPGDAGAEERQRMAAYFKTDLQILMGNARKLLRL